VVAREEAVPATEESAPAPPAKPETPTVEASLPEAGIVEGEYFAEAQVAPKSSRIR
jgi:hypothetical protein